MSELIVGTRGSALALAQTDAVCARLRTLRPAWRVERRIVVTRGDRDQRTPLPMLGDQGLFAREIEAGLMDGSLQLAVHSCKDLPTRLPPGLGIGAIPTRAAPGDVLLARQPGSLFDLPAGARIGTGSLRRTAQLRRLRPDLVPVPLRGNVETRLRTLDAGECDGLILARAGLERLGLTHRITADLPAERWYYAVGQGALAIECRQGNLELLDLLLELNDPPSWQQVQAERAFLHAIGGGCRTPVGVRTTCRADGQLHLAGLVASPDGQTCLEAAVSGAPADPPGLGRELARALLGQGAGQLLDASRAASP